MIFPWTTDAPIYHRPWATIGLMAASILALVWAVGADEEQVEPLLLWHGRGLHPLQWITSNFLHAGPGHLIGNLLGLWAFALIVEGKLGALRFLAVYLGIGFLQCGLEQVVTLGMGEGASLGASAIVYGLMAMAMVWAPKNELTCLWMFGFRAGLYLEIPIVGFALLYIAFEVYEVVFWGATVGMPVGTALLHLSGALVGFGLGVLMLRMNWVDCEYWDLFTVIKGHAGRATPYPKSLRVAPPPKPKAKKPGHKEQAEPAAPGDRAEAARRKLRAHLDAGDAEQAHAAYDRAMRTVPGWTPADADWLALIKLLGEAKDWNASVAAMEAYLRRSDAPSPRVRLKLAQVLIREQQRPAHALSVLGAIPAGTLAPDLEAAADQLRRKAERMRDDGVLELDGQAW